ncbi:hypothetical protein ABPG72_022475 [Tetrahymena utriculariae]
MSSNSSSGNSGQYGSSAAVNSNIEQNAGRNNVQKLGEHKYTTRKFFVPPDRDDIDIPDGDPLRGEIIYKNGCMGCHELDEDTCMGPSMRWVYMRKAGVSKNFRGYSSLMPSGKFYWNRNSLDQFLEDPEKMFPDTNMAFYGMKDPFDRACLIEYLHYLRVGTDGAQRQPKTFIL